MRWLPPQLALLRATEKRVLLRTGNQSYGKTTAGLAEVVYRCRGRHPYKEVPDAPVEWWIICAAWSQSIAIQKKLWALLPKDEVHPNTRFNELTGFVGKSPAVLFKNGSIIRIKTTNQDTLDLAGATIDGVMFDEPPRNQRVYTELLKRVQSRAGTILLTMTPINAPVDWIRELVDAGQIRDIHYPLDEKHLVFVGTRRRIRDREGRKCDAAWVEARRAETPAHEAPVVVDGEWEVRVEGRRFSAFISAAVEGAHVGAWFPDRELKLYLGVDHGIGDGNQVAVLVGVDDSQVEGGPAVYVFDETPDMGPTTPDQDAEVVLGMLSRWSLEWGDLAGVYGDIPAGHGAARKGNRDLGDAVARKLGKKSRRDLNPTIVTAKMGRGNIRGSVWIGERWLHQRMVEHRAGSPKFMVQPGATLLIECFDRYDGRKDSKYKHRIDALRYALKAHVMGHTRGARTIRNG
jgi:phage terminase large subunit-like protein